MEATSPFKNLVVMTSNWEDEPCCGCHVCQQLIQPCQLAAAAALISSGDGDIWEQTVQTFIQGGTNMFCNVQKKSQRVHWDQSKRRHRLLCKNESIGSSSGVSWWKFWCCCFMKRSRKSKWTLSTDPVKSARLHSLPMTHERTSVFINLRPTVFRELSQGSARSCRVWDVTETGDQFLHWAAQISEVGAHSWLDCMWQQSQS